MCSGVLTIVLADAGYLVEAERVGAACLVRARDAGDLWNQAVLLPRVVDLDLDLDLDLGAGRRRRGAPAGIAPPRGAHWQLV